MSECCQFQGISGWHAADCPTATPEDMARAGIAPCPHCGCTKGKGPGYITLSVRDKEGHILIGTGGELVTALEPDEARQFAADVLSAVEFLEAAE